MEFRKGGERANIPIGHRLSSGEETYPVKSSSGQVKVSSVVKIKV